MCQCARVIVRFTLSKRRRKGVVRECNLCVHLSVEFEQVGAADVHAAHMSMPPPPQHTLPPTQVPCLVLVVKKHEGYPDVRKPFIHLFVLIAPQTK